jgi:hypothetical protein
VIEHGLESEFAGDALAQHRKLLAWMADSLKRGQYLAGDSFSNAECAVIPYILRLELLKLDRLWAEQPAIADWWARMRARPSVKAAIFDRMTEKDWAPFKNLAPDPWPKVQELLRATGESRSQSNRDRGPRVCVSYICDPITTRCGNPLRIDWHECERIECKTSAALRRSFLHLNWNKPKARRM